MAPRISTIALATLFAGTAGAAAQRPIPLAPVDSGRLVRFHLDDQTVVQGRLLHPLGAGDANVVFCKSPAPSCRYPNAPGTMTLAVGQIDRLEVQQGTRTWRGVAIGAVVGALLSAGAGELRNGLCDDPQCGAPVVVYLMSGALGGGLWGALFGSQSVVWGPP